MTFIITPDFGKQFFVLHNMYIIYGFIKFSNSETKFKLNIILRIEFVFSFK